VRVILALLADAANVSREGKLNLLGIFDTIYANQFPTVHPLMQVVIRLEATPAEAGTTRAVEVQFAGEGDEVLFRLPGTMAVPQRGPGEAVRIDHILTLNNVSFARPGRHTFRISVDGALEATIELRVEQIVARH
jgi:hypothetical protein